MSVQTPIFTTDSSGRSWVYVKAARLQEGDFIYFLGDCYTVTAISHSGHDVKMEGESALYHTPTIIWFSSGDTIAVSI